MVKDMSAILSRCYELKLLSKKVFHTCKQYLGVKQCLLFRYSFWDIDRYSSPCHKRIDWSECWFWFTEKFHSSGENLRTYYPIKWMKKRPKELALFLLDIHNLNSSNDWTVICIYQMYGTNLFIMHLSLYQLGIYLDN